MGSTGTTTSALARMTCNFNRAKAMVFGLLGSLTSLSRQRSQIINTFVSGFTDQDLAAHWSEFERAGLMIHLRQR